MKSIAEALWAVVPNRAVMVSHFAIFCVFLSIVGGSVTYFVFNVPIWDGKVAAVAWHDHGKRQVMFNVKTIESNTGMIAILLDGQEVALSDLRTDLRSHNRLLYSPNVRDKTGKFVNKDVKRLWETQLNEIKKEIERLELKINGQSSDATGLMMIATRDR